MKRDEKLSAGMPMRRTIVGMSVLTCLGVGVGSLTLVSISRDASAAERPGGSQDDDDEADAPRFAVDPFWGLLPNNWMLGQVSGIAVDADDHVWVLHRPRTLDARQRGEEGMCCVPAPPVIELSPDGTVLRSWGGPGEGFEWPESEHGIHVDHQGYVWIAGNAASDSQVLKFTGDGEFVLQIGRAGESDGSNDTEDLGRPAAVKVDPEANEVYVADGYGNRRVIVFDADTGAYKRHWGAYGERPDDRELSAYDPEAEPIDQYRSPVHDVTFSGDGLVYVADRTNDRLQVFRKDGEFVTEAFIRPETLGSGSVSGVTLSKDADQRWLFVPDGTNNVVWILDRESLTVVDHFGRLGKKAGQFYRLHNLAIDSRGNLYTTEVNVGQRFQKFDRVRD
jgi:DNA-binding beta-propeller fold protein YncE